MMIMFVKHIKIGLLFRNGIVKQNICDRVDSNRNSTLQILFVCNLCAFAFKPTFALTFICCSK